MWVITGNPTDKPTYKQPRASKYCVNVNFRANSSGSFLVQLALLRFKFRGVSWRRSHFDYLKVAQQVYR